MTTTRRRYTVSFVLALLILLAWLILSIHHNVVYFAMATIIMIHAIAFNEDTKGRKSWYPARRRTAYAIYGFGITQIILLMIVGIRFAMITWNPERWNWDYYVQYTTVLVGLFCVISWLIDWADKSYGQTPPVLAAFPVSFLGLWSVVIIADCPMFDNNLWTIHEHFWITTARIAIYSLIFTAMVWGGNFCDNTAPKEGETIRGWRLISQRRRAGTVAFFGIMHGLTLIGFAIATIVPQSTFNWEHGLFWSNVVIGGLCLVGWLFKYIGDSNTHLDRLTTQNPYIYRQSKY